MIKILKSSQSNKIIAVDTETGEVFEPIGGGIIGNIQNVISQEAAPTRAASKKKILKIKKEKIKKCSECGKKPAPGKYLCKGLCPACYARANYKKRNGIKTYGQRNKLKQDDAPISSAANKYMCRDCGHEFASVLSEDEVICPNCSQEHCELLN